MLIPLLLAPCVVIASLIDRWKAEDWGLLAYAVGLSLFGLTSINVLLFFAQLRRIDRAVYLEATRDVSGRPRAPRSPRTLRQRFVCRVHGCRSHLVPLFPRHQLTT